MECDGHADVAPPRMDEVDAVGYEFDDLIPAYVERRETNVVRIIRERWAIAISGTSGFTPGVFVVGHAVFDPRVMARMRSCAACASASRWLGPALIRPCANASTSARRAYSGPLSDSRNARILPVVRRR